MKNPFGDLWPLALIMIFVFGFFMMWPCMELYVKYFGARHTVKGTIVDIQVSAGGYMHADLTTVIFSSGHVVSFAFIHDELQIGRTYEITFYESFRGKEIEKIRMIEE